MKKTFDNISCTWSHDDDCWFPDSDYDDNIDYSRDSIINLKPDEVIDDLPF